MPINTQGLFLALATAFTEQQPDAKHLILMNVLSHQQNTAIYQQNGRFYGTFANNQINILFS
ncbi:MAG: hypothetical protein ACLS9P_01890 [Haemophilus parainfluenzae]